MDIDFLWPENDKKKQMNASFNYFASHTEYMEECTLVHPWNDPPNGITGNLERHAVI